MEGYERIRVKDVDSHSLAWSSVAVLIFPSTYYQSTVSQ
jgi:hypothetical protein